MLKDLIRHLGATPSRPGLGPGSAGAGGKASEAPDSGCNGPRRNDADREARPRRDWRPRLYW